MSTTGPQYDGWEVLSDIGPTTSDIGPTTTFHRTVTARMGVSVRNWYNQDVRLCPRLLCQQKTSCTLFSGQVGPYWRNWRDKLLARFFWAKAGIVYVLGLCPLLLCQQPAPLFPGGTLLEKMSAIESARIRRTFGTIFWAKEKGG